MMDLLLAVLLVQQTVATDKGCIECHEKQRDDWTGSIHALKSIGCVACHGPDEVGTGDKPHAKNPATFVSGKKKTSHLSCVKCHEGVVDAFKKSAHWEDMENDPDSRLQSCLSCHGHHGTVHADRRMIVEQNCAKCHRPTSVQRKMADAYVSAAGALEERIGSLRDRLAPRVPGVSWKAGSDALGEAGQTLRQARTEQHKVERGKKGGGFKTLEDALPAAAADAEKAYISLDSRIQETGKRPIRLLGFLGLVVATLLLARAWLARWGHAA